MRSDLTEIIMVVDRSGSMASVRDDAIGGFNTFLEDQKKQPGDALLTLVLFNDGYEVVHDGVPIASVSPLTTETYVPAGMTALLDAIGKAVNQTGVRLAAIDEADRPSKVIVVILTDGQENSSREFSKSAIADILTHQKEKYSWEVIFLSSDMNAISDATTGPNAYIARGRHMKFAASSTGTRRAYGSLSKAVSSYRSGGGADLGSDLDDSDAN